MLTVYSDDHRLHFGQSELVDGKLQPCFEMPSRADTVLARVRQQALGEVIEPRDFGLDAILRVHDAGYVKFLQGAWARWEAEGHSGDLVSTTFPARRLRRDGPIPTALMGELGHYSFDTEAPITPGTWQAVYSSAQVALTAQDHMRQGARTAFALCRPPGHHAGSDFMGGYCFFNNAAIVTQAFLDQGAKRVAILDVDYHHGNGTQELFYTRNDVLFASIHGDPLVEYPYFLGHADERGEGAGEGFNVNYPLPHGTAWDGWSAALEDACQRIAAYAPDALVISLGVDTYKDDPISQFKLDSPDYLRMGQRIAALGLPTLFIMEGGYAVEAIGVNAVNVLQGYEGAAR
ncbi:histone deacetylase family protein [Pseudomonas otitidis]|uniref:histone deacetylase family protein n=1 Tax=Metapseudomonas otitidis TaxID=319939 RepID=UPI00244B7C0B|nr:histone deacetylase family protein [Pseudomonas otitidis]MDH1107265.1 histone deacetylase family protein [Pseudomonas otitidis]MDH1157192.1 histone deacetylase family protein [Pseudomonas otitidis]MDH1163391.1 histone deacetylase family protein [Pseudomonas otitidis]